MNGQILWWDIDAGCGVICDENENRIYFDVSVVSKRDAKKIKRGVWITFELNSAVTNCIAAKNVATLSDSKRRAVEVAFQQTSSTKDVA